MSYVLTVSSSISTPVSIANGGTGSTTKGAAMIALTSAAFNNSAQTATWGTETVSLSEFPTEASNFAALNALIGALDDLGIVVVV